MDRKSILVLVICFVVIMLWYPMLNSIYPPKPMPLGTNLVSQATNQTAMPTNLPLETNLTATSNIPPVIAKPKSIVSHPEAPEDLQVLENDLARYTITSHGGGIKLVQLKKHLADVGSARQSGGSNTNLASLNTKAPLPIMAILGGEAVQGDGLFTLSRTATGLRAEKQLTNGLRLVKEFRCSTNYLLEVTVRLENSGTIALALPAQQWVVGAATPLTPQDNNTLLLGSMAYDGNKLDEIGESWFANRTLGCLPGVPRLEYVSGSNIVWAAVHNQFFALAVMPQQPAPQVVAQKIELPGPSSADINADPKLANKAPPFGIEVALTYPGLELAPQQTLERRFQIYTGPKEYNNLARLGDKLGNNLDLIMGFGGFFGFFAKLLLLSMNGLNKLGLGYGFAIIGITIIIKLLFWPLTNASTKSMKRMATLQPQMKALQEKYKDDPKKMNLKLMEFMKEHKVSPVSSCFPMLLQIPVFFGFYRMLQSAIELRGAHFLWATDLSTSDTIYKIPGLDFPVNPLPLIMGVTMIWQARMTPPSPGMDPTQQKIMKYMPLMFMVFLYNFSAGLTLYWTVQNLLTIAQMKLTKTDTSVPAPTPARKSTTPTPGAFGSRKPKP